jgi:hypothetical protein
MKRRLSFRELGAQMIEEGKRDEWLRALNGYATIARIAGLRRLSRRHPHVRFTSLAGASFQGREEAEALIAKMKSEAQADIDFYNEVRARYETR